MKLISTFILFFTTLGIMKAQECTAYIPYETGSVVEHTHYDKKGKVTGTSTQEIKNVTVNNGETFYEVHQVSTDKKGENVIENDLTFRCKDNVFYMDMNSFVNGEQMKAYEDMEMEISMDEIDMPAKLTPGQILKDGMITMKFVTDTPMPFSFSVEVKNRKVEGLEKITTPAGTFDCVKLSQDIVTKTGFAITMQSVDYYAENLGAVRTETYRKGKLMGYTEITKVTKP